MSLIWELFKITIEASRVLEIDEAFRQKMEQAQKRLYPLRIGKKGQLLEFYEDYEEYEPTHRHASHLVGLYPGTRITKRGTPELFAAARRSFELRGPGGGLPDKCGAAVRLEDGELALRSLSFPTMVEMFVQSHLNEIHLLPALPSAWPEGYLRGVKARGGYLLDLEWRNGRLFGCSIRAKFAGKCRVRAAIPVSVSVGGAPVSTSSPEASVVQFDTVAGALYHLNPA